MAENLEFLADSSLQKLLSSANTQDVHFFFLFLALLVDSHTILFSSLEAVIASWLRTTSQSTKTSRLSSFIFVQAVPNFILGLDEMTANRFPSSKKLCSLYLPL